MSVGNEDVLLLNADEAEVSHLNGSASEKTKKLLSTSSVSSLSLENAPPGIELLDELSVSALNVTHDKDNAALDESNNHDEAERGEANLTTSDVAAAGANDDRECPKLDDEQEECTEKTNEQQEEHNGKNDHDATGSSHNTTNENELIENESANMLKLKADGEHFDDDELLAHELNANNNDDSTQQQPTNDGNLSLDQALVDDMKYLFKNTRYFVIKSNNYENVNLAKAKVIAPF